MTFLPFFLKKRGLKERAKEEKAENFQLTCCSHCLVSIHWAFFFYDARYVTVFFYFYQGQLYLWRTFCLLNLFLIFLYKNLLRFFLREKYSSRNLFWIFWQFILYVSEDDEGTRADVKFLEVNEHFVKSSHDCSE